MTLQSPQHPEMQILSWLISDSPRWRDLALWRLQGPARQLHARQPWGRALLTTRRLRAHPRYAKDWASGHPYPRFDRPSVNRPMHICASNSSRRCLLFGQKALLMMWLVTVLVKPRRFLCIALQHTTMGEDSHLYAGNDCIIFE